MCEYINKKLMEYTIYKIKDLDDNKIYVSAFRGIKDINKVRLSRKDLLENIKNHKIEKSVVSVENNKEDAINKLKKIKKDFREYTIYRIDKRIPIIDEEGNLFKVYGDDPDYISGKLKHVNKGNVICRDEHGNIKYISKEEFNSGKYEGIMKDRVVVKDSSGNTFSIDKNDINYKNGTYKFISVNTTFKKKKQATGFKHTNLNSRRQQKIIEKYKEKYSRFKKDIRIIDGYFYIEDFCKHGNLIIKTNEFDKIYSINKENLFCEKCKKDFVNSVEISNEQINKSRLYFNELCKKDRANNLFKEDYIFKYYPLVYKIIKDISEKYNTGWIESSYIFKNDIIEIPLCSNNNCNNKVFFSTTGKHYNLFCEKHGNSSSKENEIYDFIKDIYDKKIIRNYRYDNKELDIFIREEKVGIEFNGLYWHSEKFKDKNYHYDKWKYFNEKGIKIITIWEDDWNLNPELIKSIIRNQLKLNNHKIFGRNCTVKEVNYNESKIFLEKNHIQGNCQSSVRLGLFYNDELVSLMTFGKRTINKSKQFELLRFCNIQNTNVIGGASKLFKYFINNYKHVQIISYANLDISNGSLYETLGFINEGHTGINYWWAKDKRYSRNRFMKHKLIKEGADPNKTEYEIMYARGYNRIFGNGNIRYKYVKA
jgi:hypothetical protein